MELDLIGCWDDFALGEELFEQACAEVGDADGLDLTYKKYYFTFRLDMMKQSNGGLPVSSSFSIDFQVSMKVGCSSSFNVRPKCETWSEIITQVAVTRTAIPSTIA